MTDRELMQMALTHLEHSIGISDESQKRLNELKKALRERLAQPEQECIYPECETGIGCDGPCGEKPVDTVNTSQERVDETAKHRHEVVAWHEPGAYGNVTTHKDWALANGWEPLYKEKKT